MNRRIFWTVALLLAAFTAPASAQDVTVGGRVLVPGGTPLPEAEVRLLRLLDPLSEAAIAFDGDPAEPVARALTDADGRFTLGAPGVGLYRVVVSAPGFVDLEAKLVPLIDSRELPDAELVTDEGLTVRVAGEKGNPVEGASVRVATDRSRFAFGGSMWKLPAREGVTAADGSVRLSRGAGERTAVSVLAAGHPYAERKGLSGTAARLALAGGAKVDLALLGADDKPVAGALVQVEGHSVGRTDDAGRIVLRVGRGKPRDLQVLAPDGRRLETRIGTDASAKKPYKLTLPDRLYVSGRLIDANTRRAVDGALVWDREDPATAVLADRSGGFVLSGPAGRTLEITAGATGYMHADSRSFHLADDGRPGPTLVLRPAAAIEGKVVDDSGDPVAGAEVVLEEKQTPGMFRIEIGGAPDSAPRAITNGKGHFRLGPVDPDKAFDVKATAEAFAPTETVVRDLEPYRTKTDVRIEMQRGRVLVGRVVDLDGAPLREASLELAPAAATEGHGMMRFMAGGEPDKFTGTSDPDGKFEIRGIPVGRYDVTASRVGFSKNLVPAVELQAGDEPVDVGDITLEPGERLQGIVTDTDGLPIEGVEVTVSEGGATMMMVMGPGGGPERKPDAVSDPGGFFQVDDLAKGTAYNVNLQRTGFVAGKASVELPRAELVEVKLDPASNVSGRVLDPEGEPIAGATVNMTRSTTMEMGGNAMQMMMMTDDTTDAEGRYLFEDQRPGTLSLGAVASGFQEAKRQDIELPKGEDLEVDLPLEAGSIVEGRVMAPDGRPAIGATVTKVGEGPQRMARFGGAPVDGNGYFRLEGLVPGAVSVEATHPDYPRVVRDLEAKEGVNALDLNFEGGQEVSGIVSDISGNPVAGAAVRLASPGRFFGGPEAVSSGDGTFSMPGVQDGEYLVSADAEGFASLREGERVTVSGQPVAGVDVRLDRGATILGQVVGLDPEQFSKVSVSADGNVMFGGNSTVVDHDGNFRIENVSPGQVSVVGSVANTGRQARENVTVESGATEVSVTLQFGGGVTLSGRAVQGEQAIANAMIYGQGIDVDHSGWAETDGDGGFSIEGLEPGRYRVQLQNWQTGLSYKEEVDVATSREIELRVPTAQVRGTITDSADRQPLAGVTVSLESADPDPQAWRPTRTGTTDMDGRFTLDAVGDGSWKLAASKQGYAAATRTVTVQFDRDAEDLRMTLDPTEGLVLEARLASGGIPEELDVAVLDGSGSALTSGTFATGENGRVRLSSVPPGSWELLVSGGGSATTNLSVQAPGPALPVQLQPACGLEVTVPELAGDNGVAMVSLTDSNGRPFRTLGFLGTPRSEWRMTGGKLQFRSLPPGSWTVQVSAVDGRSWQGTSTTHQGPSATLILE